MAWFGVLNRSELLRDEGRGGGWLPQEWRAQALDESAAVYRQLFSFGDDLLHPIAVGALQLTRDDNREWSDADLFVDPPERRKGYGAAALARLEERARALGRHTMLVWAREGANEFGHGPSRAFAPARGYELAQESVQRDLDWPRPTGELDRLEREWTTYATDYEVLSWIGPTPEALLAGRAHLASVMPVEVPEYGVAVEAKRWDEDSVRENERLVEAMGRDRLVAVARHRASGELVGFTELTVSRERPRTAYQWDTLVVRAHRGHRLGGLVKIATLRLLEAAGYPTATITTFNARVNSPMIAVNASLGAYVAGGMVTWRKNLL